MNVSVPARRGCSARAWPRPYRRLGRGTRGSHAHLPGRFWSFFGGAALRTFDGLAEAQRGLEGRTDRAVPASASRLTSVASSTSTWVLSGTFFVSSVFTDLAIGGQERSERSSCRSAST